MCHFCGYSASPGSIPIQCEAALTLAVHNFGAHLAMKTYSKAKFLGLDFLNIVVASSHERRSTKQDLGFGFEQVFALQCIFSKWLDIISLRHY